MLDPREVRDALDRMESGEASVEVLSTLVSAAEAFAALVPEYVFQSPQEGLVFATQNDMLAETMLAAKPDTRMLVRLSAPAPDWRAPAVDQD